jgi:hypothetical protein
MPTRSQAITPQQLPRQATQRHAEHPPSRPTHHQHPSAYTPSSLINLRYVALRSNSTSRNASPPSTYRQVKNTGSCSRPVTDQRKRRRKRSTKTGAMSSIRHGSTSSTRTTGRTAASLTRGSTCSSWASDAERPAPSTVAHVEASSRVAAILLTPQPGSARGTDLTTGDGWRR